MEPKPSTSAAAERSIYPELSEDEQEDYDGVYWSPINSPIPSETELLAQGGYTPEEELLARVLDVDVYVDTHAPTAPPTPPAATAAAADDDDHLWSPLPSPLPMEEDMLLSPPPPQEEEEDEQQQQQVDSLEVIVPSAADDEDDVFQVESVKKNRFVLNVVDSKSFKDKKVVNEITYNLTLRYPEPEVGLDSLQEEMQGLFESILEEYRAQYGPRTKMRIFIDHPMLESPIIIYPEFLGLLTVEDIWREIERRLTSAGHIPADTNLVISVAICKTMAGKGWQRYLDPSNRKSKKSIITIDNTDELCLARALAVGEATKKWEKLPAGSAAEKHAAHLAYQKMRKGYRECQSLRAKKLMQQAGVPIRE